MLWQCDLRVGRRLPHAHQRRGGQVEWQKRVANIGGQGRISWPQTTAVERAVESTRPTLSAAKLMGARPSQPHDPFHRHACKTNKLLVFHTATACARSHALIPANHPALSCSVCSGGNNSSTPLHILFTADLPIRATATRHNITLLALELAEDDVPLTASRASRP